MKRTYYRVWCPAQEQHQEDGRLLLASSADFAAIKWADQIHTGQSVTVRVREEPGGPTRAFLVSRETDLRSPRWRSGVLPAVRAVHDQPARLEICGRSELPEVQLRRETLLDGIFLAPNQGLKMEFIMSEPTGDREMCSSCAASIVESPELTSLTQPLSLLGLESKLCVDCAAELTGVIQEAIERELEQWEGGE